MLAVRHRQHRPVQSQRKHRAPSHQHHCPAPCHSKQSLHQHPSAPPGLQSPHQQQHLRRQGMSWIQRPCLSQQALPCTPASARAGTQHPQRAQRQRCARHGLLRSLLLAPQHTGQVLQQMGQSQSLMRKQSLGPAAVQQLACEVWAGRSCSRCTGASTAAAVAAAAGAGVV